MKKPIKIAVDEDHQLFRDGLSALLEDEPGIKMAFDVSNGEELINKLKMEKVDVVLLDLNMPVLNG